MTQCDRCSSIDFSCSQENELAILLVSGKAGTVDLAFRSSSDSSEVDPGFLIPLYIVQPAHELAIILGVEERRAQCRIGPSIDLCESGSGRSWTGSEYEIEDLL
jgi:hypothetical protein